MHARARSQGGRRVTLAALLATTMVLLIAGPTSTASASATSVTIASDAQRSVVVFRREIQSTLQGYLATYGSRLSRAEYTRVSKLTAKVDRDLGSLAAKAATTTRLVRSGQRARAASAAATAFTAYQRSYEEAIATLAEVQPILQPKLGLFEALDAKTDLDARLEEFRGVGDQLKATSISLAKP